jgi:hypothetical protein
VQNVLSYIDTRQKTYEHHRFFAELLDDRNLSGEARLAWAPCVIPFIMGYSDLNKYIFRNESEAARADPLQRMLNIHTYEEDFHWQWMLDDLNKLGVNSNLTIADAARVFWSPEMKVSRQLCLQFAAIASTVPSFGVFAMVEAIEAVSITIFRHCRDITLRDGQECEFFGTKHYLAEAGHLIKSEAQPKSELPVLSAEQRASALGVVDRVFELFDVWSDSLFQYAKSHAADPVTAYTEMVRRSEQLPREIVSPTYAV